MPEVVAQVRREVPETQSTTAFQVEMEVRDVLGSDQPPDQRTTQTSQGDAAQLQARVSNALPKVPTEFKINAGPGTLAFSLSGIEAKAAGVTVKAGPSGAEADVKKGDVSAGATASFAGDAFGVKASVGTASFDASIAKDPATKTWSKWSANFKFPIIGGETVEARPPIDEISQSVVQAQSAIAEVVAYLQNGGSPTDDFVKTKLAAIKPAISKVSAAVEQRKGPKASVKVSAGGGDPTLGTSVVVSLVIEF
jgi:hypothetical protein